MDINNDRESSLGIDHDYQIGDNVLVIDNDIHRKINCPIRVPKNIIKIYTDGFGHNIHRQLMTIDYLGSTNEIYHFEV